MVQRYDKNGNKDETVAKTFVQVLFKMNENHDELGRFASGDGGGSSSGSRGLSPQTLASVAEKAYETYRNAAIKTGNEKLRAVVEAAAYYGFSEREATSESISLAQRVFSATSSDVEALTVLGGGARWTGSPHAQTSEWQAAQELRGGVELSPEALEEGRNAPPLTPGEKAGYAARTEFVQEKAQEMFGDEITLYRGIKGDMADNIPEGETEFPVYALVSFSSSKRDAGLFAGPSGKIITIKAKPSDVWLLPRHVGPQNTQTFADDMHEVVIAPRSSTMRGVVEPSTTLRALSKMNENHDEQGRFSSGGGGGQSTSSGSSSNTLSRFRETQNSAINFIRQVKYGPSSPKGTKDDSDHLVRNETKIRNLLDEQGVRGASVDRLMEMAKETNNLREEGKTGLARRNNDKVVQHLASVLNETKVSQEASQAAVEHNRSIFGKGVPMKKAVLFNKALALVSKMNENHDELGRFSSGGGGGSSSGGSSGGGRSSSSGSFRSVKTQNEGFGFHGEAQAHAASKFDRSGKIMGDAERNYDGTQSKADDAFSAAVAAVSTKLNVTEAKARDILDSKFGRHLADSINTGQKDAFDPQVVHAAVSQTLDRKSWADNALRSLGVKYRKQSLGKSENFLKTNDEQQIIYGWASVIKQDGETVVDLQGDVIGEPELVKAAHEYITNARVAKMMHNGSQIGEVVESIVFTDDLQKALGIDLGKSGWFIGMKIHDSNIWRNQVKTGKMLAFSVGGSGQRVAIKTE